MLSQEQIEKMRKKLEEEKEYLEGEINKLDKPTFFGNDVDAGDERTDEDQEYQNQMGLEADFKTQLADVNDALERIDKGIYGICEKCGKEIEPEVLETEPESRLCEKCKK